MKISDISIGLHFLSVTIDGHRFWTDTKYTILEMGYATYLLEEETPEAVEWIRRFGETIPADESDARGELKSDDHMLITSDPILFALAYRYWWSKNGEEKSVEVLPLDEAREVRRNRRILNDFNLKYKVDGV